MEYWAKSDIIQSSPSDLFLFTYSVFPVIYEEYCLIRNLGSIVSIVPPWLMFYSNLSLSDMIYSGTVSRYALCLTLIQVSHFFSCNQFNLAASARPFSLPLTWLILKFCLVMTLHSFSASTIANSSYR
ncbi:hypothetical protein KCU88_g197, partial [Aureobasidium melanogenum]